LTFSDFAVGNSMVFVEMHNFVLWVNMLPLYLFV